MILNYLITLLGIGIVVIIAIGFKLLISKTKPKEKQKKFLILLGVSIAGFFPFVILHNLISGTLSLIFKKEIEEPVFFLLATLVCPIGLAVGVIGSIIQLIKRKVKF